MEINIRRHQKLRRKNKLKSKNGKRLVVYKLFHSRGATGHKIIIANIY